jgi:signal transduction histidine kinase
MKKMNHKEKAKPGKPGKSEKPEKPQNPEKPETRDLVIANRMSGSIHGGLSRIRLSLTFRIALHYCIQLLRSFLPICLILTVVFCFAAAVPVSRTLKELQAETWEAEEREKQSGYLTAARTETVPEEKLIPRIGQQLSVMFQKTFPDKKLQFYYTPSSGEEWLVTLDLREILMFWSYLILGALICDVIRMLYFFRHEKRLNKRVLAPIRDITSMAETLSESNLSNRINIAGTKNELKDLAAVINRMLDRIERSYNSQKQFVSDASHELRTPIAVIRGYTDMLKRWGKDDPEVLEEGIMAISQETDGMKDLVESLLFLARHDKKTLMMEVSEFSAPELVQEVLKEETMVHEEHHFHLETADDILLKADRNMIKQVLRILCDNAVKYSEADTNIYLSCQRETDGSCSLNVRDEGQGIAAEELPKIFDRFYRSDKARKSETGGHGLGLSIARIIIVAHGGKMRVRSKPGAGTIFSVVLPAV